MKTSSCSSPFGRQRTGSPKGSCQIQVNLCERLSTGVSADELVAFAVDGEDVARGCGVRLQLLAKLQNVGIHGARRRGRVVAPDLIEHSVACHDLPAAAEEEPQDVELLVGQLNGGSFAGGLALLEINLHLSEAVLGHSLPEPRRMPPQAYADAGHQLAQGERLCDVVVSPDLEAEDPVDFLPLGGEHDDRRFDPLAAQLPADVQAAHARQHDVQEDQVRVLLDGEVDRGVAAAGFEDAVSLLLEVDLESLGDVLFVFYDQDLLHCQLASVTSAFALGSVAGKTRRNRLPRPASLSTSTRPPCASMMCLTRKRPSP